MLYYIWKNFFNKKECEHERNYTEKRYVINGTPYVKFVCIDCGFTDEGVVFGPTDDWDRTTIMTNGVKRELKNA